MNPASAATPTAVSTDPPSEAGARLSGGFLILVRIGWVALVAFCLLIFVVSLPIYFGHLREVCITDWCYPGQLRLASVQVLHSLGLSLDGYAVLNLVGLIAMDLVWIMVAAVLFWHRSDDWMVLLIVLALVTHIGNPGFDQVDLEQAHSVWLLPIVSVQFLSNIGFLALALFPNGRFVPRWMVWVVLGWTFLMAAENFFPATPFNRYNWPGPINLAVTIGFILSLVGTQLYRYRRASSPVQRQQTKWVVYASTIYLLGVIAEFLIFELPPYFFPALAVTDPLHQLANALTSNVVPVLIPICIGIAILRYRLWDIDIIINRTLVYGVLTVSIVALYIFVVAGLGALLQAQGNLGISLLATGLIAVLFHPLRSRLQRAINRLMYGERDDPYRVLTRLGSRLEATLAPEAVLPTIVETVALALKLPYAALTLKQDGKFVIVATYGTLPSEVIRLPLVYQTEQVGELVLAPRAPGESFTPADRALLNDLARQAGLAAHAVRLTADLKRLTVDLQRSRERLVTAREEERRRLRRDLHDGLGPQLASLTLKLETARNRLAHDPLADTLLSDLASRTQTTVADIRRLVYALRPPVLDELGLVSALGELTLQHSDHVAMRLDAPACLPELPAAVEVAIYRIAQEALTNVVRHAAASHCDICLTLDETTGWLTLSIQDDGCGLSPSRGVGVGLVSMRERAEELVGTWTIEQVPTGGTRILARLPYARTERTDMGAVTTSRVPQEEE